jgi:hypothetical protein
VFCFDFELLFTRLADPVVFSLDKGVVVDSFAVIIRAEITFHEGILLHPGSKTWGELACSTA